MKQKKTKIWLTIKNIDKGFTFTKYFETEYEKDKFKRKVKFVPCWRLVEDSTDINWNNNQQVISCMILTMIIFPSIVGIMVGITRKEWKMKKITITVKDKPDSEEVSINLDMKDDKKATDTEKVAASNVYHKIEQALKELENIK